MLHIFRPLSLANETKISEAYSTSVIRQNTKLSQLGKLDGANLQHHKEISSAGAIRWTYLNLQTHHLHLMDSTK
jgi:hypothetical protein